MKVQTFGNCYNKNTKGTIRKLVIVGVLIFMSVALIVVAGCGEPEAAREGYTLYSKYSFSFEYPQSFLLNFSHIPLPTI